MSASQAASRSRRTTSPNRSALERGALKSPLPAARRLYGADHVLFSRRRRPSAIQTIGTNIKAPQTATNFCMMQSGARDGVMREGMTSRRLLVSLVAVGTATPFFASAQQRSPFPDPQIYTEELSPRQMQREPDP